MKKLLIIIAAIVAICIVLATTFPLIGLAFSATLIFLGMHYYVKCHSVFAKILWIIVILLGLSMAVSNIPALIGLVALASLYVLYKSWKNEEVTMELTKKEDPFTSFEEEWSKLK